MKTHVIGRVTYFLRRLSLSSVPARRAPSASVYGQRRSYGFPCGGVSSGSSRCYCSRCGLLDDHCCRSETFFVSCHDCDHRGSDSCVLNASGFCFLFFESSVGIESRDVVEACLSSCPSHHLGTRSVRPPCLLWTL